MRLKNASGLYAPLLATAFSAVLGGCPTPVLDPPPTFSNAPTVVAVFAVDAAYGALGDVLVYTTNASDSARVSAKPPASYGGFRVEFSQPIVGAGIANNSDRPGTSPSTGPTSYCSELTAGNAITLVDVDDSTIGTIKSSVCYDPASALGSNPNVVILPGAGAAFAPAVNPFTCQTFAQEDGSSNPDNSGNTFKTGHKYALKFDTTKIIGGPSGKPLSLPTDFVGGSFTFTTDDFSLMAFGYQDQNTGYFTFVDKPAKGFLKDLDPVAASAFVIPADNTPTIAIFSAAPGDLATTGCTRGDGTSNDCAPGNGGDNRVVAFSPGDFWESNGTYKVTIPKEVASSTAPPTLLGADHIYTFKSGAAAPGVRTVTPVAGAVAIPIGVGGVSIDVQEPVDAASTTGFVVKKAGVVVPGTATINGGTNKQQLVYTFTPAGTLLDPNTTYTIEAKGLKVADLTPNKGATIADFSSTFVTATFRSTNIYNGAGTGLDRSVSSSPLVLRATSAGNTLSVKFTNVPTALTVTNSSVVLGEVDATGALVPFNSSQYTVIAKSASPTNKEFVITITDTTYPLKFSQKYAVKLLTSITDAASGQALKAEGCSAADCSERRGFATTTFAPKLTVLSTTTGSFKVAFNAAVDPASLNDYVNTAYKLFKTNADGSLDPNAIVMTCTAFTATAPATGTNTATTTTCTTATTLALNTTYVASATFLQTATSGVSGPAHVAATLSGIQTDAPTASNGSTFFGSRTSTFKTPCP